MLLIPFDMCFGGGILTCFGFAEEGFEAESFMGLSTAGVASGASSISPEDES